MKKMLITLIAVLTIGSSLMAGCCGCGNGGCGPESGCCSSQTQPCRLVKGTGQIDAAGRWQCHGQCSCACNRTIRAVVAA